MSGGHSARPHNRLYMSNHDIDTIITHSFHLAEEYIQFITTNHPHKEPSLSKIDDIRKMIYPIVFQHIGQDVQIPLDVLVANFKRVIGEWSTWKQHRTFMMDKFFESEEFKSLCHELKDELQPEEIKTKFPHFYQMQQEKREIDVEGKIRHTFNMHANAMDQRNKKKVPDMLEYHHAQITSMIDKANDYLHVIALTAQRTIPTQPISKERLVARRDGAETDTDTIVIETNSDNPPTTSKTNHGRVR